MVYKDPEIWKLAKNQTGPKTEMGKLKVSQNAKKHSGRALQRSKDSLLMQQMTQAGAAGQLGNYNAFVVWLRSYKSKDLQEILELENLHHLLKGDLVVAFMSRTNKDEEFSKSDLQKFKLLKDILIALLKIRNGGKVDTKIKYKSIQDLILGLPRKEEEN